MLKTDFQEINNPGKLGKASTVLKSYSNHVIKPLGQARLTVQSKTSTVETKFQIVDIIVEKIISGDLAEELGLISKVEVIQTSDSELRDYPEVTNTTGLLPGIYKIKLEEGSKGVIHA
ncbi:Pol polyprotein [Plakobranchus ocellatus]|uniref:Pol polyprotein n=1 Tax=Plakobranchus ocellatus TaxID=259542 RepID=A0AAV3XWA5_9GAST|nr:Pol polyprotein [Plakobranchus ocellatus]